MAFVPIGCSNSPYITRLASCLSRNAPTISSVEPIFKWHPVFAPRYVTIIRGAELIVSFMTLAEMRQGALDANWGLFSKVSTKAGDAFLAERFAAVIEGLDEERGIRGGFVHVLVEIRLCPIRVRTPSRGRAGGAREVRLEMFEGALRRPGL